MLLRWLDADETQHALEDQLDQLLRLADDVGVGFVFEQGGESAQSLAGLLEVAVRQRHAGHSSMISPRL
jgi:hypothetical protein